MPRKMLEGALGRAKSFVLCLSCTCTMNDYVSDTFLLVNSAVSGKQALCKITAKRVNKHTTKNFVGFRIHSHPASTALSMCFVLLYRETSSSPELPCVFHLKKQIRKYFHWEFPFGKSAFHLSQTPFEGAERGLAA